MTAYIHKAHLTMRWILKTFINSPNIWVGDSLRWWNSIQICNALAAVGTHSCRTTFTPRSCYTYFVLHQIILLHYYIRHEKIMKFPFNTLMSEFFNDRKWFKAYYFWSIYISKYYILDNFVYSTKRILRCKSVQDFKICRV